MPGSAQHSELLSAEDLIDLVRAYNPNTNAPLIREAYEFGLAMHEGQFRHSGEPYFTHPVAVAAVLTQQRLDDATIITALLHDTVEDTRASHADIATRFGEDIARLVDGVTKLTNLQLTSSETKQAENFRKLFMAMARDLRVILVKLADRLHNMRTIRSMRPEKQVQKARETMEIYAPLAGRMGMQWMREELEDLAFRVLNPDARASIIRRFLKLQSDAGDVIEIITRDMEQILGKVGIDAKVLGRAKKPYSIWRKMQEKEIAFSRLSDIYGFRVIVGTEAECYAALGAIHQRWRAVPGRFKDYISQPKSNGYRSIHTTVSGRDGKRVEVQIRTQAMHDVAETGVAAHWSYRDGVRSENPFAVDPTRWITTMTEDFTSEEDHAAFLEAVKLEMYADQVFCFTPKGDVVKLPRGATPLDFAYAIHTKIGSACVGAKIDGLRVPLWTRIRNGQSVEIVTAEGQIPQATWLDIAVTGKARTAIRRALRDVDRSRFRRLGHELVRSAFALVGKTPTNKALDRAARQMNYANTEDLLVAVGAMEITGTEITRRLYPTLTPDESETVEESQAVIGLPAGESYARASCCQPLPGERIIGISFRGTGAVIHAIDCPNLIAYEDQPDRWLDLRWAAGTHPAVHEVTLELTIANDAGVLGQICTLIGEQKANISNLEIVDRKPDFYRLMVSVELRDAEHLHMLNAALEAEQTVAHLARRRAVTARPGDTEGGKGTGGVQTP